MNRHNLMAFIACMGVGFVFMNLPPIMPSLKTIYGVNNAQIAFLATSVVLAHAGFQIPAGIITDRMGVKRTLILALALIVISSLLCTIDSSYFFVLTMRLLNGVGTGFVFCAGNKYAILFTPEKHRGAAQGIFGGSFSLGAVLPFFIMPGLMAIDWKLVYLVTALFLMVPLVSMLIWGKEVKPDSTLRLTQFKFLFLSKIILVLGFLHGIFLGSMMTLGTWFSSFAVQREFRDLRPHFPAFHHRLNAGVCRHRLWHRKFYRQPGRGIFPHLIWALYRSYGGL